MKKWISLILVLAAMLAMTACGQTTSQKETLPADPVPASSLEVLEKIWNEMPQEQKVPVFGGDSSAVVEDAPGVYDLADDGAVYTLLIPEAELGKLDGAAAMVHSLMRNVFTCSAAHVSDGNSAKAFAEAMYKSVREHVFDCGAPDQVMVAVIGGEYVVTCYGSEENISNVVTAMKAVYPGANVMYQESLW